MICPNLLYGLLQLEHQIGQRKTNMKPLKMVQVPC